MKQILMIMLMLGFIKSKAQTITPAETTEMCPNVITTFTVIMQQGVDLNSISIIGYSIPDNNYIKAPEALIPAGSMIPIFNLNPGGGTPIFQFNGKFVDYNRNQIFRVSYRMTANLNQQLHKDFVFTKIKSLRDNIPRNYDVTNSPPPNYGIVIKPATTQFTVPICQTASLPVKFDKIKFATSTAPNTFNYWGEINNYQYKIPIGWSISGNVSNGIDWITASNDVIVVTDLYNGDNQKIEIRPANSECGIGLINSQSTVIINTFRPKPALTITANPSSVNCGVATPVVFTVNGTNSVSGITSYIWQLGSNNGWLFNNTPAPNNITTTSNSITLTPNTATGVAPSIITTDIVINGNCQVNYTNNFQFILPTNSYTISGQFVPCSNTSTTYTLTPAPPAGSTVSWSIYPNDGSVNITPNGSSVSVDLVNITNPTYFNLTANIEGYCHKGFGSTQIWGLNNSNWNGTIAGSIGWSNGVYYMPLVSGDNYLYTGSGANYFEITIDPPTGMNMWNKYWEFVSGDFAVNYNPIVYDLNVMPFSESSYNFHFTNECGTHSVPFRFIATNYNPPSSRFANFKKQKFKLTVSPNPASNIINISLIPHVPNFENRVKLESKKYVKILDIFGNIVYSQNTFISKTGISINISMLKRKSIYKVIVEDNGSIFTQNLIVD